MKVKILGQTSYQSFPETDDMIEIDDELLKQIGKTKCFDVDTKKIIDYTRPDRSTETQLKLLRAKREKECFEVINRGVLWYDTLTPEEKSELKVWYKDWLDVTETLEVPKKPKFLS